MSYLGDEQLNRISSLVREIEKLSDIEKLVLYLQLPGGRTEIQDGASKLNGKSHKINIFSKKPDQETTQTYTWILSHLEEDTNVSLPKQEVYDEYRAFCQANRFEPLCVADFGKAMKHAFPCIKPRRLGQRGNSRYCYSGLRKKYKIEPPNLPELIEPTTATTTTNICNDTNCLQQLQQQQQQQQQQHHQQQQQQQTATSYQLSNFIRGCGSSGSNGNGNNATSNDCESRHNQHSIGSTHDLCPMIANRTQFTGYEVMNLKIDADNDHNQSQQQQQVNNGNTNNNNNNYANDNPQSMNGSNSQHRSGQHPHECSLASVNHANIESNISHQSLNNNQPDYNRQSTIQQQQQRPTQPQYQYNYQTCAGRSVSPDDDEYVHYYQDSTSIDCNRHLMCASIHPSVHLSSPSNQSRPLTEFNNGGGGGVFLNHIGSDKNRNTIAKATSDSTSTSTTSSVTTTSSSQLAANSHSDTNGHNCHHHHNHHSHHNHNHHQHQQQQHSDETHFGNDSLHLQLADINESSLDFAAASPFQSPASTPYPMMSNYLVQSVQDYYAPDCIRYSEGH